MKKKKKKKIDEKREIDGSCRKLRFSKKTDYNLIIAYCKKKGKVHTEN